MKLGVGRRNPAALLTAGVAGVVAATLAVGLALQAHRNDSLGDPLPPFVMSWHPRLAWPIVIAAGVVLAAAWLAPWAIRALRSPLGFAATGYAATVACSLAVNATRGGVAEWSRPFSLRSHEGPQEYLPALFALRHGIHFYVAHFAQLLPQLPTHTQGNPPGPVVVMHLLGLTTAGRLAAACILAGALITPATYALGRTLGDERRGRVAAALAVLSPALILFGTTSADLAFAALGALTAWLLLARPRRARVAGYVLAGIGSFFSWVLLAIPAWAVLVELRRSGVRAAARTALGAAAGVIGVTLLLVVTLGYDPLAVLRALGPIYAHGRAAHRPYAFWLFGSPVAWLVMLGPGAVWLGLRALHARDPAAIALAVVLLVAAVAGFTKAETERIWLPFVPLACVAAAAVRIPEGRLRLLLLAAGAQTLVIQLLFTTVW